MLLLYQEQLKEHLNGVVQKLENDIELVKYLYKWY